MVLEAITPASRITTAKRSRFKQEEIDEPDYDSRFHKFHRKDRSVVNEDLSFNGIVQTWIISVKEDTIKNGSDMAEYLIKDLYNETKEIAKDFRTRLSSALQSHYSVPAIQQEFSMGTFMLQNNRDQEILAAFVGKNKTKAITHVVKSFFKQFEMSTTESIMHEDEVSPDII